MMKQKERTGTQVLRPQASGWRASNQVGASTQPLMLDYATADNGLRVRSANPRRGDSKNMTRFYRLCRRSGDPVCQTV